jgi:hypothetical protein
MTRAHKSECPAATGQDAENQNTNELNFATGERYSKAIFRIRAQLALLDHEIHEMECGDFLVYSDSVTCYCRNFNAVQAFAHRLAVNK